jgi:hypothetical protein
MYRTYLIAPRSYITKIMEQHAWHCLLSLEEIAEWARSVNGAHEAILSHVCDEAVTTHAKAFSEASPEATAFWQAYRETAAKLLPELEISRLPDRVSRASPWPRFAAGALPEGVLLEHKPQEGRVDLTVSAKPVEQLRAITRARLLLGNL